MGGECPTSKISLPAVEVVPSNLAAVVRIWSIELDEMKKKGLPMDLEKKSGTPCSVPEISIYFFQFHCKSSLHFLLSHNCRRFASTKIYADAEGGGGVVGLSLPLNSG